MTDNKRSNKNIVTWNYELYQYTDLRECRRHRAYLITAGRVSGTRWQMGIVTYLMVNSNKHNSLRAGSHIKLLREIVLKRAVINIQTVDNAYRMVCCCRSTSG